MDYTQADKLKFHPTETYAVASATDTYSKGIDSFDYGALSWGVTLDKVTNGSFDIFIQESDDNTTWVELGDGLNGQPAGTPYVPVNRMYPPDGLHFAVSTTAVAKCCGSFGKKRYQRLRITSVGVTTSANVHVTPVQGHPIYVPVAD